MIRNINDVVTLLIGRLYIIGEGSEGLFFDSAQLPLNDPKFRDIQSLLIEDLTPSPKPT